MAGRARGVVCWLGPANAAARISTHLRHHNRLTNTRSHSPYPPVSCCAKRIAGQLPLPPQLVLLEPPGAVDPLLVLGLGLVQGVGVLGEHQQARGHACRQGRRPGRGGGGPPLWPGGESQVRACDKQGGMAQARKLEGRGWNVEERCQQGPGAMGAMAPDLWSAAHPRSAGPHPQARAGPCSPAGTAWARAPARKEVCVCGGGGGGGKH